MAFNQNKRLNPKTLARDVSALAAMKDMTPAYAPTDSTCSTANLDLKVAAMDGARAVEVIKRGEFMGARDDANAAEWAFHNAMLTAKGQVLAQYGADSDQVQAIGRKKKSERKRPAHRTPPAAPSA